MDERENHPLAHEDEQRGRPSTDPLNSANLRERAEQQALTRGAPRNATFSTEELLHELQVHQIELEAQNHELQRAQEELERSRARYVDLFEHAPIGYLVCDEHGIIKEANVTVAGLLGEQKKMLLGHPLTKWIAQESETTYYALLKGLVADEPQERELLLRRGDGSTVWSRFQTTMKSDPERTAASYRVTLIDITEIKKAAEISATAFLELQHRVKNTLAQIDAFIRIQAGISTSSDATTALNDLALRVGVLSNLYTTLHADQGFYAVRLNDFLSEISLALVTAIGGNVELKLELDEITLDAKEASCFGLIANELITNAMKHAFPDGQHGVVTLRLKRDEEAILLEILDDGIDLPEEFSFGTAAGFGNMIILNLAKQLGGETFFERGHPKKLGVVVKYKSRGEPGDQKDTTL